MNSERPIRLAISILFSVAFLCLFLVVGSQASPALESPTAARERVEPTTGTAPTAPLSDASASAIDCQKPPAGQTARLLDDVEIGVVAMGSNFGMSYDEYNNPVGGKSLVEDWGPGGCNAQSGNGSCTAVQSVSVAMLDEEGKGKRSPVMAYRDKSSNLAIGFKSNTSVEYRWKCDQNACSGSNVGYIDVAAGNLEGHYLGTRWEEPVLAFRDNNKSIHLVVPVITPNRSNHLVAEYRSDTSNGRGNVQYVAVATGDLDGDGYTNEIVTAFKDSINHLQVMILKKKDGGTQQLQLLWSRSWTAHDRGNIASSMTNYLPVDVTTGDIDGDFRDEVIVAFRDNRGAGTANCAWKGIHTYGWVQLLVLDRQADGSYDDRVFTQVDPLVGGCPSNSSPFRDIWPTTVSVAAADLDGNGQDEVALGFVFSDEYQDGFGQMNYAYYTQALTFAYVPVGDPRYRGCVDDNGTPVPCLQQRPGSWRNNSVTDAALSLDAGDLDQDGKAEIALVGPGLNHTQVNLFTLDAGTDLTQRANLTRSSSTINGLRLAVGDVDKDAVYGNYTGECKEVWNTNVTAVVHSPPYWSEYNAGNTSAGFGESDSHGGGSGETTETSYGGSLEVSQEFKGIGASFTWEWEKALAVEQQSLTTIVQGHRFDTEPSGVNPTNPYWDAVGYDSCPRWCYDYKESRRGTDMSLCWTRPIGECLTQSANMDYWYNPDTWSEWAPTGFADSWVPVGMNLARGGVASQSTTGQGAGASRAVDGNTTGDFNLGSVSRTADGEAHPYWDLNLVALSTIRAVQLWNRTDCCGLSDFYVFVSEDPFPSNDPTVLLGNPKVWHTHHAGPADRLTTLFWSDLEKPGTQGDEADTKVVGRYVRVQLAGSGPLSLAELQVWGTPREVDAYPRGEAADKSGPQKVDDHTFKIRRPDGSYQLVDGQIVWTWAGAQLGVSAAGGTGFDTSKLTESEQVIEGSTSVGMKVGCEIKTFKGEVAEGSKHTTSRSLTWGHDIEFSGDAGVLEEGADLAAHRYGYKPYIWLQRATSQGGVDQAFLVIDYWVPSVGPAAATAVQAAGPVGPSIAPQPPLIASPTHPDAATWYSANSATFTWAQPPGDPATVTGYRWYLDRNPDAIPSAVNQGLAGTYTYPNLKDGVWYLHVRAQGTGSAWSETAHRAIRVDANPPQVELALDPPLPNGSDGWYTTPLTATVTADDGTGSGVALIEVSPDGVSWQPYVGPVQFASDTTGTTIRARARDAAGHVSEPVTATFKSDLSAPDSRVVGGPFEGVWIASIVTDPEGNEHLALEGEVSDAHSGWAGLTLQAEGTNWTSDGDMEFQSVDEEPFATARWSYREDNELGRGNHLFYGRAHDRAGNAEETYLLAEVVWFPPSQDTPDLAGSAMSVSPTAAAPGEEVEFLLVARNGGYLDAMVAVTDTLPAGLTLVADGLGDDIGYDPGTGTITWPPQLLWPGDEIELRFRARLDDTLGAGSLKNQATVHAFWPNTDGLPEADRQRFRDHEQTALLEATLAVNPNLPTYADVTAPWVNLSVHEGQMVTEQEVELGITASADARRMYLREWVLDSSTGSWTVARNSGWIGYHPTYTWELSAGDGVKYLGAWVADSAGNISALDKRALAYTNLVGESQSLANGQRTQYRFAMDQGKIAAFYVTALAGDPDLYVWQPRYTFWPTNYSNGHGEEDAAGRRAYEAGVYLVEVAAVGDSRYRLTLHPESGLLPGQAAVPRATMLSAAEKARPPHPLTVSDPLSASAAARPEGQPFGNLYLPLIHRDG